MTNNELNNVLELIKEQKYELALAKMVDVKPLKDCEQNNPHHKYNVYNHIIKSVEFADFGYLRTVVKNITIEEHKNYFIDNEEKLIPLLKLVMLLHDVGKPVKKGTNAKTGFDNFIAHEKASEDIANEILPSDFEDKEKVLWLIKNHEYINKDTCNNKNSVRKRYKAIGKDAILMFMLPIVRLADINAQSGFEYQDKYQQNIDYIKTLEEVIKEDRKGE